MRVSGFVRTRVSKRRVWGVNGDVFIAFSILACVLVLRVFVPVNMALDLIVGYGNQDGARV